MANEILVKNATPICWADSTQYASDQSAIERTHEINLKSLASTAARQGEKADLNAIRPQGYVVKAAVSFAVAPTAGSPVEFYWSSSSSATPGVGNAGGYSTAGVPYVSGVDGLFAPAGGAEADIDEYKQHLSFVGVLAAGADALNVQHGVINSYFSPPERYGQWVIKNKSGQAFSVNGSGVYVALIPVVDEIQ
jgi:hypothetical protein